MPEVVVVVDVVVGLLAVGLDGEVVPVLVVGVVVLVVGVVAGLLVASALWCLTKCPLPEGFSVPDGFSVPEDFSVPDDFSVPELLSPAPVVVPLLLSSVVDPGLSVLEVSYLAASIALLYLSFSDWGKDISFIKVNVPKFMIS